MAERVLSISPPKSALMPNRDAWALAGGDGRCEFMSSPCIVIHERPERSRLTLSSHRTRAHRLARALGSAVAVATLLPLALGAQTPVNDSTPRPIKPPATPLASEAASAGVTKFSFIAYGDTRGRHDGAELQAEHTLVMEGMLAEIKKASTTADPIRFVLQSGDAVVNGSIAKQLNVSYLPIIERLTSVGVPYFLSVGNHDVGNAVDLTDKRRMDGLRNYFTADRKSVV